MNPNEIKKALENWIKNFDGTAVEMATLSGAFLYIDQLEAEVVALKKRGFTYKFSDEQIKEIHRRCLEDVEYNIEAIKSEAVKEFAERLCVCRVSNDPVVIVVKAELKEMVVDDG